MIAKISSLRGVSFTTKQSRKAFKKPWIATPDKKHRARDDKKSDTMLVQNVKVHNNDTGPLNTDKKIL